jgi:hypothetical protein
LTVELSFISLLPFVSKRRLGIKLQFHFECAKLLTLSKQNFTIPKMNTQEPLESLGQNGTTQFGPQLEVPDTLREHAVQIEPQGDAMEVTDQDLAVHTDPFPETPREGAAQLEPQGEAMEIIEHDVPVDKEPLPEVAAITEQDRQPQPEPEPQSEAMEGILRNDEITTNVHLTVPSRAGENVEMKSVPVSLDNVPIAKKSVNEIPSDVQGNHAVVPMPSSPAIKAEIIMKTEDITMKTESAQIPPDFSLALDQIPEYYIVKFETFLG